METMGLTVFFALCILGLDFMIYVLFELTYGDKRSAIARRVAEQRKAAQAEADGLILVPVKKGAPTRREPVGAANPRSPSADVRKLFSPNSCSTRIA